MADILIVDDDRSVATAFQHFLNFEGHECRLASSAGDALQLIDERKPNLVMMDVRMPGMDGLQALEQIRAEFPDVYVVIMTAYGTSQTSIDAIRSGAFDYLTKPLDLDQLRSVIRRALAAQQMRAAPPREGELPESPAAIVLVGESPAMLEVYKMIGRLTTNDVPALIAGERGTGKGLVVATIHDNSARREQPLRVIDCATAPESAIEAELFDTATGTIQLAHVTSLSPLMQSKLARGLHERGRPGSGQRIQARVLASTELNVADAIQKGQFSRELYDALAVITLEVPSLRARREDIPLLVRYFIQRFNAELSRSIKGVDDQVIRQMQSHSWPGNVGELERVVKRACIVATSDAITVDDVGNLSENRFSQEDVESVLSRSVRTALQERLVTSQQDAAMSPFHAIVDLVETTLVREALAITGGNQVKAAEILGVNRATLRKKMTTGNSSGAAGDE